MDYLYELLRHYKGDSGEPRHGLFTKKQLERNKLNEIKDNRAYKKKMERLEIVEILERIRRNTNIYSNMDEHGRNRYPLLGPSSGGNTQGIVHKGFIENIFDSLDIHYTDEEALIFRDTYFFRIDLKTQEVFVHRADDTKKYASLCIHAVSSGWSNTRVSPWEVVLLAKIISIAFDELPTYLYQQIEYYILHGKGGPNLTVCHPTNHQDHPSFISLRDEMLQELERLRGIMRETDDGRDEIPQQSRVKPPTDIRSAINQELRDLFRRAANNSEEEP